MFVEIDGKFVAVSPTRALMAAPVTHVWSAGEGGTSVLQVKPVPSTSAFIVWLCYVAAVCLLVVLAIHGIRLQPTFHFDLSSMNLGAAIVQFLLGMVGMTLPVLEREYFEWRLGPVLDIRPEERAIDFLRMNRRVRFEDIRSVRRGTLRQRRRPDREVILFRVAGPRDSDEVFVGVDWVDDAETLLESLSQRLGVPVERSAVVNIGEGVHAHAHAET